MNEPNNIGDYIREQETMFSKEIRLFENWNWNFKEHVRKAALYMHSQLLNGKDEFTPVVNITRPILLLQERATGFDVKDITIYLDDSTKYFKSFLVKMFFKKWARENGLDTVIDQMVRSFVLYGGALLKNVNDAKPEVVELKTIAFGDQRDLLAHPFGILHDFSPSELMEQASVGWGSVNADITLEELVNLHRAEPKNEQDSSGIPIYEIHGHLPEFYLDNAKSKNKFVGQLHIVSFYRKQNGDKAYVTLFKGTEKKLPFKLIKRDPVAGRALGFGGAEELEEDQVWTNYAEIREQNMLDGAAVTVYGAKGPDSSTIAQRNNTREMKTGEILDLGQSDLAQVDTFPRNAALFEKKKNDRLDHARMMGAANESIMGESPSSGTPFKLQELVTQEAHSLHNYRKGQLATFWDEVMQDWIVPYIARAVIKEQEFLAELDLDDLQYVQEAVVTCETNNMIKEKILNGELIKPEDVEGYKEIVKSDFKKKGNKHFIKILEGEMKNAPIVVKTNIVGKQKYLSAEVDKLVNLARTLIPQGQDPMANKGFVKLLNQIIERSGLDPVDFQDFTPTPMAQQPQRPQQAALPQQTQPAQAPAYV